MENNDLTNKNIENEYFDDPNYLYDLETYDLPYGCPYRQMVPFGPGSGPGFGGPQGPGFGGPQGPGFGGPQGPGFGPQGPGFGPQGPGFGPQGPGFGPQGPGSGPPTGQQGAPSSPPPNFTPSKSTTSAQGQGPSAKFVEPGTIRPCVFRFVYIWPTRGRGFWAWLTYVGRRSVAGFQWNGRSWVYFGMDLRRIDSFQCF